MLCIYDNCLIYFSSNIFEYDIRIYMVRGLFIYNDGVELFQRTNSYLIWRVHCLVKL